MKGWVTSSWSLLPCCVSASKPCSLQPLEGQGMRSSIAATLTLPSACLRRPMLCTACWARPSTRPQLPTGTMQGHVSKRASLNRVIQLDAAVTLWSICKMQISHDTYVCRQQA